MRIAITGGTGFVGGHLARSVSDSGHEALLLARGADQRPWAEEVLRLPGVTPAKASIDDLPALIEAFDGCEAIAHCAGTNREVGRQTYAAVHVQGTANVVRAAEEVGARRLVHVSFLRARPACGSPYHESKWAAEEIVRSSRLEWTVLNPGMMFGLGDHMLDHLSHSLYTFPFFVGVGRRPVRPLAVGDAVAVMSAALIDGRVSGQILPMVGPTELGFDDAARLVAEVVGKSRPFLPAPIAFHYALAYVAERVMPIPLVARAQVRILQEGVVEAVLAPDHLPADLVPSTPFDEISVRAGLPKPGPFGWGDLKWMPRPGSKS